MPIPAAASTFTGTGHAVSAADHDPFVRRVKEYSADVLRPSALTTDAHGVLEARVRELRTLGLLHHLAPPELGGASLSRDADRRVHEHLSGACFNTWLVWAQHAPMVGRLAQVDAAGGELSSLARRALHGEVLLGAGISDVRRYPTRYVRADRTAGGWTFTGTVSWVSGWGLNEAIAVAAVDPTTETVVTALVPVGTGTVGTPLHLAAVGGSRTERVTLRDVHVPDEEVIGTQPVAAWRLADHGTASDARAHHFGLAFTVLDELQLAPHRLAVEVADRLRPRVEQIRADAYGLADEAAAAGSPTHRLTERLRLKAASGETLATLTRALVIARSGRGLAGDSTSQLHARSALFVLIQGQTSDVRDAQLGQLLTHHT